MMDRLSLKHSIKPIRNNLVNLFGKQFDKCTGNMVSPLSATSSQDSGKKEAKGFKAPKNNQGTNFGANKK